MQTVSGRYCKCNIVILRLAASQQHCQEAISPLVPRRHEALQASLALLTFSIQWSFGYDHFQRAANTISDDIRVCVSADPNVAVASTSKLQQQLHRSQVFACDDEHESLHRTVLYKC